MKVTLIKDWQHPAGTLKKKGQVLDVTNGLKEELQKGGFIESDKKEPKEDKKDLKIKESITKKDK